MIINYTKFIITLQMFVTSISLPEICHTASWGLNNADQSVQLGDIFVLKHVIIFDLSGNKMDSQILSILTSTGGGRLSLLLMGRVSECKMIELVFVSLDLKMSTSSGPTS